MTSHDPDDDDEDSPNASGSRTNGAGSSSLVDPGSHAPARDAPPPAILELVASCVRFVLAKYRVELDGTPDTLGILDHYVKEARAEIVARPEGLELVEAAVGAYFGEVVRGVFESTWHHEGDKADWRLRMKHVYLTFNPIGMAREALTHDDAPGWHAHIEVDPGEEEEVQRRLAVLPEVAEDEYYALSTRFDVIELTVVALRARMRASGLGDVVFTDEDYEKA
jgi:hypothetical protein